MDCISWFGLTPQITWAMHIMEGFLPVRWSIIWSVVSLPFLIIGLKGLGRNLNQGKITNATD